MVRWRSMRNWIRADAMDNEFAKITLTRRILFNSAAAGAWMAVSAHLIPASAAINADDVIRQPNVPGDAAFIERAFEMRDLAVSYGDQAYGAVVVRDGLIIGQSWSRVILDSDPTAHAEMAAIRDAARRLADRDLSGAVLYSSSRACPMCEAGAYWGGIGNMIHGRGAAKAGRPQLCR